MKQRTKKIERIEYYINCPDCEKEGKKKEIRGGSPAAMRHNLNIHKLAAHSSTSKKEIKCP
ncbi:MAG: hypothetical protein ACTSQ4_02225 [Candidatus Heimdallarchaeaceae archaeon]